MKKRKQLLSLALAGSMLLALTACGNQDSPEASASDVSASTKESTEKTVENSSEPVNELDWLNTDGDRPLVKEGTEKTLSIYVQSTADHGKPEDSWLYKYITEELNVNLEFTTYTKENMTEFLSLAFARSVRVIMQSPTK